MKKLLITKYSDFSFTNSKLNTFYSPFRMRLLHAVANKRIYTVSIVFSFKKKTKIQVTGFCKSFFKRASKGASFRIIYTYGKSYIIHIFPFYSNKFLSFSY